MEARMDSTKAWRNKEALLCGNNQNWQTLSQTNQKREKTQFNTIRDKKVMGRKMLLKSRELPGHSWKVCIPVNKKTTGDGYISGKVGVIKIEPRRSESLNRWIMSKEIEAERKPGNLWVHNSTRHLKKGLYRNSSILTIYVEQGTAIPESPSLKSNLQPCFYHYVVTVKINNTEISMLIASVNKGKYYQNNEQENVCIIAYDLSFF